MLLRGTRSLANFWQCARTNKREVTSLFRTIVFSVALVIAASVLGYQVKQVGGGRETISVKGLAEKPIKADRVEWTMRLQVKGATIADALGKLRKERPALDEFLGKAGFDKAALSESNESSEPNYEQVEGRNGNMRSVQDGHIARQSITINTTDIGKIIAASRAIVQFEADGHPVSYGEPQFLVSNLEEVKMSLIGAAMQNSRTRAEEFAKNGDVEVGWMRSASQGAFYILAAGADQDVSDWGGSYDKTDGRQDRARRGHRGLRHQIAELASGYLPRGARACTGGCTRCIPTADRDVHRRFGGGRHGDRRNACTCTGSLPSDRNRASATEVASTESACLALRRR